MKKKFFMAVIFVICTPQVASALDLSLQPRFKSGVQYYEYEQDSVGIPAGDPQFPEGMISKVEFSDWLPFIGGGVTLFIDRFLVDFDVQYSFDGQDDSRFASQAFTAPNAELNTGLQLDTDFDRLDLAASAGFTVSDNFVIFAGYKRARTNFDADVTGEASGIPGFPGSLTVNNGKLEQRLDYNGPFIGASYNFPIEQGFLEGALSFNLAVAFMDGEVDLRFKNLEFAPDIDNLDGDTTGVSVGANWKGITAIDGLGYFMGVNGYRYKFDNNEEPDFSETQVRLDFGLAYALDF